MNDSSKSTEISKMEDTSNKKRLKKSRNKMIFGVCAGIAEYFDIDPTIVRLIFLFVCLAGGSGILAYIIAAIVMPPA